MLPFKWCELDKWLEDNRITEWAHTDRYSLLRAFGPREGFDEWLEERDEFLDGRNNRIIGSLKVTGERRENGQ